MSGSTGQEPKIFCHLACPPWKSFFSFALCIPRLTRLTRLTRLIIIIINLYLFLIKVKVILIIQPAADPQSLVPCSPAVLEPSEMTDFPPQPGSLTWRPLRSVLKESLLALKAVTRPRWSQNCLSEHFSPGGQVVRMTRREEPGRSRRSQARVAMMSSEQLRTFAGLKQPQNKVQFLNTTTTTD